MDQKEPKYGTGHDMGWDGKGIYDTELLRACYGKVSYKPLAQAPTLILINYTKYE